MADGDATIRLDQGGINARILAKEAKVDFRRVESASRKIQATFYSPEVKRLFVRYLNSMQLNTYLISVIARSKLPHHRQSKRWPRWLGTRALRSIECRCSRSQRAYQPARSQRLDSPGATLSFHLKERANAGMVELRKTVSFKQRRYG